MPTIDLSILNQRQTPAFYADVFANRPAAGYVGRIFVSTDTFAFYRDNGTGWDLIGGPGTGTITGSGATGQIALWDGASTITGDTGLTYDGTDNSLTASKFIVTGGTSSQFLKADGSVDSSSYVPYTGATASLVMGANNILAQNYYVDGNGTNSGGFLGIKQYSGSSSGTNGYTSISALTQNSLYFQFSQTNGTNKTFELSTALLGTTIRQYQLPDADGTIALTSNLTAYVPYTGATANVNLGAFDLTADLITGATGSFTSSGGSNTFGITHSSGSGIALNISKDGNGEGLFITKGSGSGNAATINGGLVRIENNSGDAQLQIVSSSAPSVRIDNAATGATKRVGLGLATAVNNFIQGSVDQDFCIFNSSTTASPILFGIYDAVLTNTQEAARISPARNLLVGTITDSGQKLIVNGTSLITGAATFSSSVTANGGLITSVATNAFVDIDGSTSGTLAGVRLYSNGSTKWIISHSTPSTYRFSIGTATSLTTFNEKFGIDYTTGAVSIGGTSSAKLTVKEVTTGYSGYFGESQTSAASNGLLALQSGRIPQSGGDTSGVSGVNFLHSYGTGGVNGDANGGYIRSVRESVFGTTSQVNTSLNFATASANVDAEVARFTSSKNFLINTTTDSGYRLAVLGTMNVSDAIYGDYFRVVGGVIGGNQTSVYLAWNNAGNISIQQVTVGAADSGGTGYRVLRIPNT